MKTSLLLVVGLLVSCPGFSQSFAITGLLPARNAPAPMSADLNVTFSQPLSAASTGAVRVFGSQRHGRLPGQALVTGNTLVFNPLSGFMPGELISATITTAAQSSTGTALATPQVFQFRAAAVGGTGMFPSGNEFNAASLATVFEMAVADLDGDGDLDVVTPSSETRVVVRKNDGRGGFPVTNATVAEVGYKPISVILADVDSDGDVDMLAVNSESLLPNQQSTTVTVRLNDGNGAFAAPTIAANGIVTVQARPTALAAADVDADGDLDLVVATAGSYAGGTGRVSIRLNNGAGVFGGNTEVTVAKPCNGLAVADIDNDGDVDLLSADYDSNTLSVRKNDGTGQFSGTGSISIIAGGTGVWSTRDIKMGDLDGDGDLDVIIRNKQGESVDIFLNDGQGNFSSGQRIYSQGTACLGLSDLDGDGDLDILTQYGQDGTSSAISTYFNNGQGRFTTNVTRKVTGSIYTLSTGDLDGDGDLDCVTLAFTSVTGVGLGVFFNDGTGPLLPTAKPTHAPRLAVYPNPAQGEARLRVARGTREVAVLNAMGQRLRVVAMAATETEVLLPLSGLSAGVYTVQAGAAAGRLVIQ
ncbi:hypothetical protein E5K00_20675 [Hymenobacter aquaticus]|uniref:SbsA Ig-like domain-containing protein n=1 Tax=Hymenobacter aquaticus TaxID=1867101 RepID=A0A4Z0PSX4_9BACT|nr:FG-GAP-like repeat-containing protein [Hymenobacter aquaticus]TGE20414.1 hypothetical protein E5K00_20675 [Hymenobacter aquaticus]